MSDLGQSSTRSIISVIIPAYNAEEFLPRTLQSVLTQSYRDLEVIVIDDGSTDTTCSIVETIASQDARVILLQQPNAGVASARNFGIQNAKGDFIAPIDADDIWYPGALEKLVGLFFNTDVEVGVVYAWSVDIDAQDQPTGGFHAAMIKGDVHRTLLCHNFLGNASSSLIRRSCLEQVGGYDTQLKAQQAQGCEDWDLYLRLAERYEYQVVPEFLVGYRNIGGSMSRDFDQMARSQKLMLQTFQQKHPDIPGFFYRLSQSSYYLYLAHQSDKGGHAQSTLHWLKQAITIDSITPLVRFGFYALLIKSLIRLLSENWRDSEERPSTHQPSKTLTPGVPDAFLEDLNRPLQSPISRHRLWLKLMVGTVLHQSLSKI